MAIGTPTQVGTNTSQVNPHTSIAAAGCVIPANSLVVVAVGHSNGSTASGDPSAVSDGTTSYTKDSSDTRTTTANSSLWSFYDAAGGTRTITATIPSSNVSFIYVFTISGAASTLYKDVTDNATGSGGTQASTVTTSANVAQADSVAMWALYRTTSSTWTTGYPPTNYTSLANVVNATRGTGFAAAHHKTLTAGATESAACSLPATAGWAAPLVVYKGAASGSTKSITPDTGINATSTVAATISRFLAVKGTINGTSNVTATVSRLLAARPSAMSATSAMTGTASVIKRVAASVAASSLITAAVSAIKRATGAAVTSTSAVTGQVGLVSNVSPFLLYPHTGTDRIYNIEQWLTANMPGFVPFGRTGLDRIQTIEAWLTVNPVSAVVFVPFGRTGTDRMWTIESYLLAASGG